MPATISTVLIVKNEEINLRNCLKSISWSDEIIVLDSGSTDNTISVAESFGAKVFVNNDWPGFGIQRQIAQKYATCDWIFVVDADEIVTPELETSIRTFVSEEKQIGIVSRLSHCFGRFIRHSGWYPDRVARLYPRKLAQYDSALVHEKLENPNNLPTKVLDGDLIHYPYKNLRHYLTKSAQYAEAWSDQKYQKGKKANIMQGILHGIACFLRMYIFRAGFMDGKAGFLLALLSAHSTFVKYADLWLRGLNKK